MKPRDMRSLVVGSPLSGHIVDVLLDTDSMIAVFVILRKLCNEFEKYEIIMIFDKN